MSNHSQQYLQELSSCAWWHCKIECTVADFDHAEKLSDIEERNESVSLMMSFSRRSSSQMWYAASVTLTAHWWVGASFGWPKHIKFLFVLHFCFVYFRSSTDMQTSMISMLPCYATQGWRHSILPSFMLDVNWGWCIHMPMRHVTIRSANTVEQMHEDGILGNTKQSQQGFKRSLSQYSTQTKKSPFVKMLAKHTEVPFSPY